MFIEIYLAHPPPQLTSMTSQLQTVQCMTGSGNKIPIRNRRTSSELAENAAKELESLSEYMPNISDIEARTLALWLYYMEVVEGQSFTNAQNMVSKMFGWGPAISYGNLASAAQSTQTSSFRRSPLSSFLRQSFPNYWRGNTTSSCCSTWRRTLSLTLKRTVSVLNFSHLANKHINKVNNLNVIHLKMDDNHCLLVWMNVLAKR